MGRTVQFKESADLNGNGQCMYARILGPIESSPAGRQSATWMPVGLDRATQTWFDLGDGRIPRLHVHVLGGLINKSTA